MAGRFTESVHFKVTRDQWDNLMTRIDQENINLSVLIRRYIDEGLSRQDMNDRIMARVLEEAKLWKN